MAKTYGVWDETIPNYGKITGGNSHNKEKFVGFDALPLGSSKKRFAVAETVPNNFTLEKPKNDPIRKVWIKKADVKILQTYELKPKQDPRFLAYVPTSQKDFSQSFHDGDGTTKKYRGAIRNQYYLDENEVVHEIRGTHPKAARLIVTAENPYAPCAPETPRVAEKPTVPKKPSKKERAISEGVKYIKTLRKAERLNVLCSVFADKFKTR